MKKLTINCRGVEIPLYNRIVNLGLFSYERTSKLIDKLNTKLKEWEKVNILINDYDYITFLKKILRIKEEKIFEYLNDFYNDKNFKKVFSEKLANLEKLKGDWGDVRFHSLSLYTIVRGVKPNIMIETGVASGKSTSLILLAMEHNQKGKLISIDLPNIDRKVLKDGARTSTGRFKTGWLIPNYLKKRWKLKIGNSIKILWKIVNDLKEIDIFFHDSLHTYSHVKNELIIIQPKIKEGSLIICDNIDMGAGKAFNEFLNKNNLIGYAYRDFGGVIKSKGE
jgi:hypothetical protein